MLSTKNRYWQTKRSTTCVKCQSLSDRPDDPTGSGTAILLIDETQIDKLWVGFFSALVQKQIYPCFDLLAQLIHLSLPR